jgi:thiol:disulfide interchange protein DsbD
VDLIADARTFATGQTAKVAVRFVLEKGWHLYWRNPGDSGEAPTIEWNLPQGFSAGEIEWPAPHRIPVGPLVNFGFEGTVLLAAALRVPTSIGDSVRIGADTHWLVCDPEECIPGSAKLDLVVRVGEPTTTELSTLFDGARKKLPLKIPSRWALSATADAATIRIGLAGTDLSRSDAAAFFPFDARLMEASTPQAFVEGADGLQLIVQRRQDSKYTPASIDGVLRAGDRAFEITVPVAAPAMSLRPLAFAFAGGLLLNLMPCVFPILALKALALVGHGGEGRGRIRRQGIVYGLGVLVSFWMLAGVLLVLRAGGEQLGWGFQLQSPAFVAGLAALFFWMSLSLLGLTDVGTSIMGFGSGLTRGDGDRSAFFTGVLATVVATPCTAPFMGTALGYALAQPAAVALSVFTALGSASLCHTWRSRSCRDSHRLCLPGAGVSAGQSRVSLP